MMAFGELGVVVKSLARQKFSSIETFGAEDCLGE